MPYVSFDEDKSWWSQNVIIFSKHSPFMFLLKYSPNRGPLKKWTEHFTQSQFMKYYYGGTQGDTILLFGIFDKFRHPFSVLPPSPFNPIPTGLGHVTPI